MAALDQHQFDYLNRALGRDLTPSERQYLDDNEGPDIGFYELDRRPGWEGRKNLVLYTACPGVVIRHYIKTHRPDIYAEYSCHHLMSHALSLRSALEPAFQIPQIFPAVIRSADLLIYNPVDSEVAALSDREVVRLAKPECRMASFGGPHHGCWWVICPSFGEEAVVRDLKAGLTGEEIWQRLKGGTFDPMFAERFKTQMAFLKGYQHGTDVRMAEFIQDCYRDCKMFFTFNHSSVHLLAYITDECLGQMGFPRLGREHAVSIVKADECMIADVQPETHYEFEHFGFRYPMRWQDRQGGLEYYHQLISTIEAQVNLTYSRNFV